MIRRERLDCRAADPVDAGLRGVQAERRDRQRERARRPRRRPRRAGAGGRGRGSRSRCGSSPLLRRRRCTNGIRPFSTRSPSFESMAGRTVSEREHRDRDDEHRPDREGHERLVAGEEHAGHRDQHGDARRRGRPGPRSRRRPRARRARCGRRPAPRVRAACRRASSRPRRRARSAGSTSMMLLSAGDALAGEREQAGRGDDRRERDQQRDQGRDQRAEHEHQDDDRERDRDQARPWRGRPGSPCRAPCRSRRRPTRRRSPGGAPATLSTAATILSM